MNIRNLPSEYAVAFVVAAAFIVAAMIMIGTKKLSSDLDEIDVSMRKTKSVVENNHTPPNSKIIETEME